MKALDNFITLPKRSNQSNYPPNNRKHITEAKYSRDNSYYRALSKSLGIFHQTRSPKYEKYITYRVGEEE